MEDLQDLQPLFPFDEFEIQTPVFLPDEDSVSNESEHTLLYPSEKNTNFLETIAPLSPFVWNNINQAYRNISIDDITNEIIIKPLTPLQLLKDRTFQAFLKEYDCCMILVARLGYEVHFGLIKDYKDAERKIIRWFNHHIYDTTIIVDIHDFYPRSRQRRIQTYQAWIAPKHPIKGVAKVYWRRGYLHSLESLHP